MATSSIHNVNDILFLIPLKQCYKWKSLNGPSIDEYNSLPTSNQFIDQFSIPKVETFLFLLSTTE